MGFGGQPPLTPPPSGLTKDQRKNAKAMAKLDKVVQAEGPRVYKALSEAERLEAARFAFCCCICWLVRILGLLSL